MGRYINADNITYDYIIPSTTTNTPCTLAITKDRIDAIPTADVAPVKHGHWDAISKEYDSENYYYICSVCGQGDVHHPKAKVSYCWNCGSKMDEVMK